MAKPHAPRLTPNVSSLTPKPKPKPKPNPNPITLSPNPNPNLSPSLAQEQDCELSTVALAHVYADTLQPYCNPTTTRLALTPTAHPSPLTPLTLTPLTRIRTP